MITEFEAFPKIPRLMQATGQMYKVTFDDKHKGAE